MRTVRDQIGRGADWVKLYADYRWGRTVSAPTFTQEELNTAVNVASSANIPVAAHANTTEGMRRAAIAGVNTIEHGDGGTAEVFRLMKENGVALCATLSVAPGARAEIKRRMFETALETGVSIASGSDVGVFPHGDNVRELEAMVAAGMPVLDTVVAATSGNARILNLDVGRVKSGHFADLIAVQGDPSRPTPGGICHERGNRLQIAVMARLRLTSKPPLQRDRRKQARSMKASARRPELRLASGLGRVFEYGSYLDAVFGRKLGGRLSASVETQLAD